MIIESLCWIVETILTTIINLLDILPQFPVPLVNILNEFFDLIFDNLYLINFFVDMDVVKIVVPVAIAVINAEHIYSFVMWILRKIPLVGIK